MSLAKPEFTWSHVTGKRHLRSRVQNILLVTRPEEHSRGNAQGYQRGQNFSTPGKTRSCRLPGIPVPLAGLRHRCSLTRLDLPSEKQAG